MKTRAVTPAPVQKTMGATVEGQDPALSAALLLLTLSPTPAHHRAVADEYRRLRILDTAFDHLSAATRLDPRDAAAYDARARIWRDWGFPELGMGDSARAVFYAPRSAAAHNTRGTLLAAAGLKAEALREFEAAIALDPDASFARENVCRLVGC
jgi:tetratricopeptide (TPR) repeat protein